MNATEQRNHRTALGDLGRHVEDITTAMAQRLDGLDADVDMMARLCTEKLEQFSVANTFSEDTLREELKRFIGTALCVAVEPLERGFWGRLKWLIIGR